MSRVRKCLNGLVEIWMSELYKRQEEYERSRCLFPDDGSDWRRLK